MVLQHYKPSAFMKERDVASGNRLTGFSCVPLTSASLPTRPSRVTLLIPANKYDDTH